MLELPEVLECFHRLTEQMSMSQTHYYVYHAGEQIGPFSLEEVASKVHAKEIEMSDYVYDDEIKDWTILVAFPLLAEAMAKIPNAPLPTPIHATAPLKSETSSDEWFALKGDLRFGPFAYTEIVRLLQDKSMYESDFVWHVGMTEWQKIADLPEFNADAIKKLRDQGLPLMNEVFFRRRHTRVQHDCSILMHNNQKVFRGKGLEISAGGAGIVLDVRESKSLDVGHQVFLHFKPASDLPPFNAVCEVVSRRPVNSADPVAPMHYGVKFLKIEAKLSQQIEKLADRQRAGNAA